MWDFSRAPIVTQYMVTELDILWRKSGIFIGSSSGRYGFDDISSIFSVWYINLLVADFAFCWGGVPGKELLSLFIW